MGTVGIREGETFIRLGQAMKKAGMVGNGGDAKLLIQDGLVRVNGVTETRRGRKLTDGDKVEYDGETFTVTKGDK